MPLHTHTPSYTRTGLGSGFKCSTERRGEFLSCFLKEEKVSQCEEVAEDEINVPIALGAFRDKCEEVSF